MVLNLNTRLGICISVTKSKSWIFHEILYTHNPKWLSYCQLMVSNATILMNKRICSFTNISANKNESGASTCVCSCYYISHKTWLYSYKCERVVLQKFSWYKTFHVILHKSPMRHWTFEVSINGWNMLRIHKNSIYIIIFTWKFLGPLEGKRSNRRRDIKKKQLT